MKKITMKLLIIVFMLTLFIPTSVQGASTDKYSVKVQGTYYYSKAKEVLDLINTARGSGNALTMDASLTELAMQRAAECAVEYSHTRPDGTSCFTISSKSNAENIASGYSSAQTVYNAWMNSSGHYKNIMNSDYRSVGIGCFSYGGLHFWVQIFSNSAGSSGTLPSDSGVIATVSVLEGAYGLGINIGEDQNYIINIGSSLGLTVGRTNPGITSKHCDFTSSSFVWSSNNSSVAVVDASGNVKAISPGDAVITAKPASGSGNGVSITVHCRYTLNEAVLSEPSSVYYSGEAYTPKISVTLNGRTLTKDIDYDISYLDNINVGKATIQITGKGNYSGTLRQYFNILQVAAAKISQYTIRGWDASGYDSVADCIGTMMDIVCNGRTLKYGVDYKLSYYGLASGTQRLTYFGIQFMGNYSGTNSFRTLEDGSISTIADQSYTGKAIVPAVKVYSGNTTTTLPKSLLTEGTDYTIKIENNIKPGTAKITVTGMGAYFGSFTANFKIITPASGGAVSSGSSTTVQFTAALSKSTFTYTGKAQKPGVVVKNGSTVLKNGTDYTLKYSSNKKIGTGTVVVIGKGKFAGLTKKLSFKIIPKKIASLSAKSKQKACVTISWKRYSSVTGYQVQISAKKNFKSNVKKYTIKKNTKITYTIKSLKSSKKYYVRVRAYKTVSGKTYYGSWSVIQQVKTK